MFHLKPKQKEGRAEADFWVHTCSAVLLWQKGQLVVKAV